MNVNFKSFFKRKNIPFFIIVLFVLGITVTLIYSSTKQTTDWYESKSLLFTLQRSDYISIGNVSSISNINEEYYFKVIKTGYGLVTLEFDYAPSSTLAILLENITGTSNLNLLTLNVLLPDAIVSQFVVVPVLNNNLITSIATFITPPIVVKADWGEFQTQEDVIKNQLLIRFPQIPSTLNVKISAESLAVDYSTTVFHPANSNVLGNLTLCVSYQFTKGGILKSFVTEKNIRYSNNDYEHSVLSIKRKSLLLNFLESAQGIVVMTFISLVVVTVLVVVIFSRKNFLAKIKHLSKVNTEFKDQRP